MAQFRAVLYPFTRMANPLATLGQYRIGSTEYGAGRARTDGSWHLVRKQYGDNSSTYSYARFVNKADYLAARANPSIAVWQDEPFSSIDYTLILLPMATPLPASTAAAGAITAPTDGSTATAAGISTEAAQDKQIALLQQLLTQPAAGSTDRATETTLAAVAAQLAGTLNVAGKFFQATQPVSGPLTDTQLRATPVPVSGFPTTYPVTGAFFQATQPVSLASAPLPAGAATDTLQKVGNAVLSDISTKLGGTLTVAFPTAQPVSGSVSILGTVPVSGPVTDTQLRATPLPVSGFPTTYPVTGTFWQATQPISATSLPLPTGASTYAAQQSMQTALDAIKANTATNAGAPTPVTPYSLVAAMGNNATSVKTSATQLTGLTVTNATSGYRYLMLYNLATAPVTGSTPLITLGVPPTQSVTLPIPSGKYLNFSTGLSLAVGSAASLGTLVSGLLGTTGVSANDMVINATYA
jgi:hypothetical protein